MQVGSSRQTVWPRTDYRYINYHGMPSVRIHTSNDTFDPFNQAFCSIELILSIIPNLGPVFHPNGGGNHLTFHRICREMPKKRDMNIRPVKLIGFVPDREIV